MHHETHVIESVRVTQISPSLMKVRYGTLHILLNKANSFCPSRSINFSSPSVRPAISSVNIASSGGFQQQQGFGKLERRRVPVVCWSVLAGRCVSSRKVLEKRLEKRICRWMVDSDSICSLFFIQLNKCWVWCSSWFPESREQI